MDKRLKSILQVIVSLAIGFFLIWIIYKDLSEEDKANVVNSFREANYWWIVASMAVAILSHVFRAYRWKYPLEALDLKIDLPSRFAAVMIGYLANLAFPRLGEVTRCAVLARYKKMPFEKLFGTVLAERLVDAILLLMIIILAVVIQVDVLRDFIANSFGPLLDRAQNLVLLAMIGIIVLALAFIGWKFLQRSGHPLALKFRSKLLGLVDGFATLKHMEGQVGFYFHTLMIWLSYVLMFVLTFNSFPETAQVPLGGMLAAFALGGITIVVVQGGLGAYPLAIMLILGLYGVSEPLGYAFGWIVWTAQTLMIILAGFLSVIALPLLNTNLKTPATVEPA